METVHITFNGRKLEVEKGRTILDIATEQGIFIPTLCEEPRLDHYASCRVCLVEVKGAKAFMPACSTYVWDGMDIIENSEDIKESRKMSLELMLSNHFADCYPPCNRACPANVDIQGYIAHIANGEYKKAIRLIKEKIALPVSIGRICPQLCGEKCYRNEIEEKLMINPLKRFVAEKDIESLNPYIPEIEEEKGIKVAVVGSGPAGLSAAYYLRIKGYQVTIFEKLPETGGMLRYGIPAYRLPKELLDKEIDIIRKMGVEIKTRVEFGKDVTVEELKAQGYKAFFVGIGAQYDTTMGIPGEDANGSFRSIEFLRDFSLGKLPKIGDICAVVGGGNTAMDVCRTLVRLGAKEVHIIYRRNKDAMPADPVEIREAEEEGVIFDFLRHPQEVILDENGLAKGVKLIKMELGEPDSSGRRSPVPVEGYEYIMELDAIVTAIGQKVDSDIVSYFSGMNTDKKGRILIEEDSMLTSVDGVFAGGDCVLGPSTVVESIATGRNAAEAIIRYLTDGVVSGKPFEFFINKEDFRPVTPEDFAGEEKKSAQKLKHISPDVRKKNFDAYEFTLTEEQVKQEAMRCMQCGCQELFDCKLKEYCTTYEIQKDRYAGTFKDLVRDTSHPYIEINFNKCILCGRCVRVCEELVGVNALGYINRGFPTQIGPRMDSDFFHSPDCISCGECADTCPTGAIASLPDTCQPGPHTLTHYKTVCANCDLGCEVLASYNGGEFKNFIGDAEAALLNGMMCATGKFGSGYMRNMPVDWSLNISSLTTFLQNHRNKKVGVLLGGGFTNEEYRALIPYVKNYTDLIGVLDKDKVSGFSNTKFSEILSAKRLLLCGDNLNEVHGSLRYYLAQAKKNGIEIVFVGDNYDDHLNADSVLAELPELHEGDIVILSESFITEDNVELLSKSKYVLLKRYANENGRDELLMRNGIKQWDLKEILAADVLVTFNTIIPEGIEYNRSAVVSNIGPEKTGSEELFIQNVPLSVKRGTVLAADMTGIRIRSSKLNDWIKVDFSVLSESTDFYTSTPVEMDLRHANKKSCCIEPYSNLAILKVREKGLV